MPCNEAIVRDHAICRTQEPEMCEQFATEIFLKCKEILLDESWTVHPVMWTVQN